MEICKNCGIEVEDGNACTKCGGKDTVLYNYTRHYDSMKEARKSSLEKWKCFNGRSRREEYWKASVLNIVYILAFLALTGVLVFIVLNPTLNSVVDKGKVSDVDICSFLFMGCYGVAVAIYLVYVIVAQVAVTIRRFHDIGLSGWLTLVPVVPFVAFVALICLGSFDTAFTVVGIVTAAAILVTAVIMMINGRPGFNKYGSNPKEKAQVDAAKKKTLYTLREAKA